MCYSIIQQLTLKLKEEGASTLVSITQECGDDLGWADTVIRGWAWVLDSLEHYFETGCGIPGDQWEKEHMRYVLSKK